MEDTKSEISEFFHSKDVFVTGGSGFIGKCLLEKLLRSCPNIGRIYLLMRQKKGMAVKERLQSILDSSLFVKIKEQNPEQLKKIVLIYGDLREAKMGITEDQLSLLFQNTSVVFHLAATVRFNETLKNAVNINVYGTLNLLEICKKMTKLQALVYVSTAYSYAGSNCVVEEKFYPPLADPKTIIDYVNEVGDETAQRRTKELIGSFDNTYCYSKSLAENLIEKTSTGIPAAVIRPTVVTASWNEPTPGWIEATAGATLLFTSLSAGVMQIIIGKSEVIVDLIPVDVVVNSIIASAWHVAITRPTKPAIFHCASSKTNPLLLGDGFKKFMSNVYENPKTEMVMYPRCIVEDNRLFISVYHFLYLIIPAYILETLARLTGREPKLVKIVKKIINMAHLIRCFMSNEWIFDNSNLMELKKKLNFADKKTFNFDIKELDWSSYMKTNWLGIREYLFKEEVDTIPDARKKLKKLYWIDKIYTTVILLFLLVFFVLIILIFYKYVRL